jgi:hypothetical protein
MSFPSPAEKTISLYAKSQANYPIANPLMNLILMRLETAVVQCPWEVFFDWNEFALRQHR